MTMRLASLILMMTGLAGLAQAQTNFPGRMPGDVPYAHEYGANRPFQPPVMPPPPPPPPPPLVRMRSPELSPGYQPVRPAPRPEIRVPERHSVPPEKIPPRGKLIDVEGPRIVR